MGKQQQRARVKQAHWTVRMKVTSMVMFNYSAITNLTVLQQHCVYGYHSVHYDKDTGGQTSCALCMVMPALIHTTAFFLVLSIECKRKKKKISESQSPVSWFEPVLMYNWPVGSNGPRTITCQQQDTAYSSVNPAKLLCASHGKMLERNMAGTVKECRVLFLFALRCYGRMILTTPTIGQLLIQRGPTTKMY